MPPKKQQKGMDYDKYCLFSLPMSPISCHKTLTSLKSVLYINVCVQHHI